MGVVQVGGYFDLAEEAVSAHGAGQFWAQHLEGGGAPVAQVTGEVHRGHAAATQLPVQGVAISEGGVQVGEEVGCAGPQ